jgi:hypothetical protein
MKESNIIDNPIEAALITSISINIVSGIDLDSSTKQIHARLPKINSPYILFSAFNFYPLHNSTSPL